MSSNAARIDASSPRSRRAIAALLAFALVAFIGVPTSSDGAEASPAESAPRAADSPTNPFSSTGGFTVYAEQNATLSNDELEGSLAVGDTLSVTESATYAILHVVAGTGAYSLPTVDGDPTRLLAGHYDDGESNVGSINITNAGREQNPAPGSPESRGTLKLVDRDIAPFVTSARGSGWVRMSMPGSAPPLIDATAQTYPSDAGAPEGSNTSIFTENTSADTASTVSDYVRADEDASSEDTTQCLANITDPSTQNSWHVGIAEDVGDRKVLGPLAADRPNVVPYEDVAGAGLLQFSTEVRPGADNPLIIKVPEGTTDVQGLRIDPAAEYAPYTMWDLSAATGEVTIANSGGRIDGSVYAPFADVSVDAAPLEGQVFGRNVTLLGGEVHSYLFSSTLPCGESRGTFQVMKNLEGISSADLPEGTTFPLGWTATLPDRSKESGTIRVPADGTASGPTALDRTRLTFPVGTVVDFDELDPGAVPGWEWTERTIDPPSVTISDRGDAVVDVNLTNAAQRQTGTFDITKSITDGSASPPGLPSGTAISVDWTADRPDGGSPESGTIELTAEDDGSFDTVGPVDGDGEPVAFPVGTTITLSEPNLPTPPEGYSWADSHWSPGSTFTIERADQNVSVDLVNLLAPTKSETAFTVAKRLDSEVADVPPFTVEYTFDPPGTQPRTTGQAEFGPDSPARISSTPDGDAIPDGSTVWVKEADLPSDGQEWQTPKITADGVELSGPDEDGFYELPLTDNATVEVEIANKGTLPRGTFSLDKQFDGPDPSALPDDIRFGVEWTADYPDGSTVSGHTDVRPDEDPVVPTDPDGNPLEFPEGTTVSFTETEPPVVPGWTWGETTIDPATITIAGNDTASVSVTNGAEVEDGTFSVTKALSGIGAGDLLDDGFDVEWEATLPDGSTDSGVLDVPGEGSPTSPDRRFPTGTLISLSEPELSPNALPGLYEWAGAVWHPGSSLVVGSETAEFTVTNTAVPGTSMRVEKSVTGDGADDVPDDTAFPVEYRVAGETEETSAEISPSEPLDIDRLGVGSVIEIREGDLPEVPGVDWGDAVWMLGDETLEPDDDGWVAVRADSTEPLRLALRNTATRIPDSSFTVSKALDGLERDDLPADTVFSVAWEAALPDGTTRSGTLDVPADGTPVGPEDDGSPMTFPEGTEITYSESQPDIDGITWEEASFAPESVTIGDDGAGTAVTLTNTGRVTDDSDDADSDDAAEADSADDTTADSNGSDADDSGADSATGGDDSADTSTAADAGGADASTAADSEAAADETATADSAVNADAASASSDDDAATDSGSASDAGGDDADAGGPGLPITGFGGWGLLAAGVLLVLLGLVIRRFAQHRRG